MRIKLYPKYWDRRGISLKRNYSLKFLVPTSDLKQDRQATVKYLRHT